MYLINELVTNTLKYAFPDNGGGKFILKLEKQGDNFLLMVGDNGISVPADFLTRKTSSLGTQLINRLVKQANGSIEILIDEGALFKITMEDKKSVAAV